MRILLLLLGVVWGTSYAEQLSFIYYREQGRAVFEAIMEQFSQQYHHQVSFHQITSETLKPALVKSVMRGTAADVVFAPSDIIGIAEQAKFSEVAIDLVDPNTPKELLHTALNKQKLYCFTTGVMCLHRLRLGKTC
jgi:maltose-binding protein MalE